jgi:sigma-B regulation protein RsbU (phosphoserine phosphatase)
LTKKDQGQTPGSAGSRGGDAQSRASGNPSVPGLSTASSNYPLRLRDQIRENQLLFEVGSKISSTLDLKEVLNYILDALDQLVPFDAACVYLLDERGEEVSSVTQRGYAPGREEDLRLKIGTGIVGWVAMTGQDAIVTDVRKDPRYQMAREETRSEMVVPIRSGDDILGAFNLESDDLEAYDFDDLRRLTKFAGQASIAIRMASLYAEIEEKRRMEEEIAVARRIQGHFLPGADPAISGYDISGLNVTSLEVSGDYFDYFDVDTGQLGLVIADVSGKGIPAGLIMAAFRASLLAEVRNNFAIRMILSKVNRLVYESSDIAEFVTAVYGVLDEEKKLFTYANAGHNPPLLFRPGKPVERLSEGGIVLGAFPDAQYTEATVSLSPGDVLGFYTDGVTEALSPEGEEFGENGLEATIRGNLDLSAKAMCHAVRGAVRRHTAREPLSDDLTLMIVKVES